MAKGEEEGRLPINFHQTFIPERTYISALLRFAAGGGEGTHQQISIETGIPVGRSSGKVPAILSYCLGMGLIRIEKGSSAGSKRPVLTPFGRSVLLEDSHLNESLTQWLAHLHLCRVNGGAEVWHLTFGRSRDVLGMSFSENDLEGYLASIHGRRNRSLIGPLIGTYEEPTALKSAAAISRDGQVLTRSSAPLLRGFTNGYAGLVLSFWEVHFSHEVQITLTDFETKTYMRRICGWSDEQFLEMLTQLQEKGIVDVDKQNPPWVLTRRCESSPLWRILYDDLA